MSDIFDEREKGYEAKFKLDEELNFKIRARRNKLLGYWLAEKFDMRAEKIESYSKEIVMADLDEPGIDDVIRKVMTDIKARGLAITEKQVTDKISDFEAAAVREVTAENMGNE